MTKLTIKDIAKLANVSPTTVSFVINNKEGVSEDTRNKIREIIKQTNFIPNVNSRRLILKKSFNINVTAKENAFPFNNLFYMDVIKGILKKSKDFGYNLMFSNISESINNSSLYDAITQRNTDGIIFLQDVNPSILQEVEKNDIPYVVVDTQKINPSFICVKGDYELSSYTAVNYLIDKGHKDIAFIGMGEIPDFYLSTFNGYKRALSDSNISLQPSWVQSEANDEETAFKSMANILKSDQIPSAVYCAGDILAIGAMKCAKSFNYKIPEDISFFGLDDIIISQYIEPALTTIRIDEEAMGCKALDLLIKLINKDKCESYTVISDNIIERESVNTLNGAKTQTK